MSLPQKALKQFKAGDYAYRDDVIAQVIKLTVSKTGKHGHCRATLSGRNIETQQNVMWSGRGEEMVAYIEPVQSKWIYIQPGEFIDERGSSILVESILAWPEKQAVAGDGFVVKRFMMPNREVNVFLKWESDE